VATLENSPEAGEKGEEKRQREKEMARG